MCVCVCACVCVCVCACGTCSRVYSDGARLYVVFNQTSVEARVGASTTTVYYDIMEVGGDANITCSAMSLHAGNQYRGESEYTQPGSSSLVFTSSPRVTAYTTKSTRLLRVCSTTENSSTPHFQNCHILYVIRLIAHKIAWRMVDPSSRSMHRHVAEYIMRNDGILTFDATQCH